MGNGIHTDRKRESDRNRIMDTMMDLEQSMGRQVLTVNEIAEQANMPLWRVRDELRALADDGLVERRGTIGGKTRPYRAYAMARTKSSGPIVRA